MRHEYTFRITAKLSLQNWLANSPILREESLTEALNLIRNRKGNLPHIVAVTAEPLPMRIASLALGTGDIDCVYHFALDELRQVCEAIPKVKDQSEMLAVMVEGSRLRDISDLPFDIVV